MEKITLYTVAQSRGRIVRWMLEECEAEYEVVPLRFGRMLNSDEYLSVNPMGKVPALQYGSLVITETLAIITFLADLFSEQRLIPSAGSPTRARYYQWMCFSYGLEYAAMDKWRGMVNNEREALVVGYGDFERCVNTICRHIEGSEYMVGNSFSAMDIYFTSILLWLMVDIRLIPMNDVLKRFVQFHTSRPSFMATKILEEELARQPRWER